MPLLLFLIIVTLRQAARVSPQHEEDEEEGEEVGQAGRPEHGLDAEWVARPRRDREDPRAAVALIPAVVSASPREARSERVADQEEQCDISR